MPVSLKKHGPNSCTSSIFSCNPMEVTVQKRLTKSIPRISYSSSQPAGCCSIRILLGGQFQSMAVSFKECCQMFPKVLWTDLKMIFCGHWIFRLLPQLKICPWLHVIRLASFDEALNVPMTTILIAKSINQCLLPSNHRFISVHRNLSTKTVLLTEQTTFLFERLH